MSSYITKAKNKTTGEVVMIAHMDDHFGLHRYGHLPVDKYLKGVLPWDSTEKLWFRITKAMMTPDNNIKLYTDEEYYKRYTPIWENSVY